VNIVKEGAGYDRQSVVDGALRWACLERLVSVKEDVLLYIDYQWIWLIQLHSQPHTSHCW